MRLNCLLFIRFSVLLAMACKSEKGKALPALLLPGDKNSLHLVRNAVFDSVGGMNVASIDVDITVTSNIVASPREPNRYEMNSLFMPVWFELIIRNSVCYFINKYLEVELSELKCRPA